MLNAKIETPITNFLRSEDVFRVACFTTIGLFLYTLICYAIEKKLTSFDWKVIGISTLTILIYITYLMLSHSTSSVSLDLKYFIIKPWMVTIPIAGIVLEYLFLM